MDAKPKPYVIACGVLGRDLRRIAGDLGITVAMRCLPGGLHETPQKLKASLQAIIDEVSDSGEWSRIVLGYGICGRGTVDLKAGAIPLVIPKVHDCIALFLGGNQAYRKEYNRFPGTYYISQGWFKEKSVPASQQQNKVFVGDRNIDYEELVDRLGEHGARKTAEFFNSWKINYQRAAFIDTGSGSNRSAREHAQRMAKKNNWRYETIAGDMRLLSKLLTTDKEDGEVLVVPPGQVTYFNALTDEISTKPFVKKSTDVDARQATQTWSVGRNETPQAKLKLGLGIDAGGTYTDVVIFDFKDRRVLAKHKSLTTRWDYAAGIRQALKGLKTPLLEKVEIVAVSTTLATNAIVEGEGQKVGLMLMAPEGVPAVEGIDHQPKLLIAGRLSITGKVTELVDEDQVRDVAQHMIRQHRVEAFAVSGYAGHINPEHELQVKQILTRETGLSICCGHELSNLLDFTVRAQTAVLNARIIPRLGKLVADIRMLLATMGIHAPIMVVKGDGSLMTAQMAMDRPVETILSGPAASAAGAKFMTQRKNAVVVDIGGTTTDTALIADQDVAIRESGALIGGIHTHVKALDIRTAGLGGDSHIIHRDGVFNIGPRRVTPVSWLAAAGYPLEKMLAFLEQRRRPPRGATGGYTFIALSPKALPDVMPPEEQMLVDLLQTGPASILELTERMGVLHPDGLPLDRLLACNSLFRCALTPTDLLQAVGRLEIWDQKTAKRVTQLVAKAAGLSVEAVFQAVWEQMVRAMAIDIIKMHLDPESDPESIDECAVCRTLLSNAFGKSQGPLQARYRLSVPIIGIGAPAVFFLPDVARCLDAELLLPPNQDVANAIGAVTSRVEVKRQSIIKPDTQGGYYIEGLPGRQRFTSIDDAQEAAVGHLLLTVRRIAVAAGTRQTAVHFASQDRTTRTAWQDELFIDRVISATLNGPPDVSAK